MKRLALELLLLGLLASFSAWAEPVGKVAYLSGTLSAKKADGSSRLLAERSEFDNGDVLSTTVNSFARIKFVDGGEIALRPNTSLEIKDIHFEEAQADKDSFIVALIKGGCRAVTGAVGKRNKARVAYNLATATIGIRGTHFGVLFCQGDCEGISDLKGNPLREGAHMDVADGAVEITNNAGSLVVEAGHFAYVEDENARPELVDDSAPYRVSLPASVMFDESAQLWSEKSLCATCALR